MNDHIYLAHHGIKGMKWGVRRFQNEDGTLTDAGKKRYKLDANGNLQKLTKDEKKEAKRKRVEAARKQAVDDYISGKDQKFLPRLSARNQIDETRSKFNKEFRNSEEGKALYEEWSKRWDTVESSKRLRDMINDKDDAYAIMSKHRLDKQIAKQKEALDRSAHHIAEAEGKYTYTRMVKKYGDIGMRRFMDDSMFLTSRDAGESYIDWYVREQYDTYRWDESDYTYDLDKD